MSPRSAREAEVSVCSWRGCTNPTRDHALVCEECLDKFSAGLRDLLPSEGDRPTDLVIVRALPLPAVSVELVDGDEDQRTPGDREALQPEQAEWCVYPRPRAIVPGLWDELQATIVGERAIDYSAGGAGGGSGERGVVSVGLVLPEAASDIAEVLRLWLRHLVRLAVEFRLDHYAPPEWVSRFPQASVPGMAEWLAWRVDAMAWNPEAADAAGSTYRLISQAAWVVNRPSARQDLGDCPAEGCDGHLSAIQYATFASCDVCRQQVEAQPLRDRLLDTLDDRLCTAAEIAHLTTYLGLRKNREQVRKQVNQWAHRGPLAYRTPAPNGDPRFRFGDAKTLLLEAETRANTKPERPTHTSKGA